ncbi:PP2C family protein-serine/threonine phosphatase [Hufsiella ginkgonis]|uniref:SpoIIE family protein phosphatase n=1 Tax=Hufsiella ginkgonis TaxID=2695274 RepID=A0A7K1Y3N7_9SPHI|nr:PP2C family protein-serine/threonine phosphatase [Hufsiella ginkgonis]MXV17903.1 SpoIIE family protein phosphatase [Hufsiella ginkgonis]
MNLPAATSGDANESELIQLLLKRQAELNSLLEITQAINRNNSNTVLFEMLEVILKVHLRVGKMRLLIRDSSHFYCAARYGGEYETVKVLQQVCQALQELKNIEHLGSHPSPDLCQYDYFVPVLHKSDLKAFVLIGDFDTKPDLVNNDLNFMQTLINVIVVALDNKKLFRERVQRERMQRDMELASEVQSMLVPLKLPKDQQVQAASLYLPNQNIGGDYFDFIRINGDEFLWCIADVTGKGVSAALLMANLQASLRAWSSVESDLKKIIEKLNSIVVVNTNGERFITLFLGKYNQQTRVMNYVNAGHNPPVLIMDGAATTLNQGTTIIGAFDELPFVNSGTITLTPGSLIFNYTDGLIESADENIFLSDVQIAALVMKYRDLPVGDLNRSILADIQSTYKAKMNSDDITVLTIRIL